MVKECLVTERLTRATVKRGTFHKALSLAALALLCSAPSASNAAAMPAHFKSYAMTDIGNGLRCIVGDTTDEGLNGKAYVYVVDLTTHKIRWVTRIPLTPRWYQNRATHCLADDTKVYALDQSDTSSFQTLSQTFVDVVTLDRATGRIESTDSVIAKDAGDRASTWVEKGAENFRFEDGKIIVSGQFFNLDDPETRKPFTASPTKQGQ